MKKIYLVVFSLIIGSSFSGYSQQMINVDSLYVGFKVEEPYEASLNPIDVDYATLNECILKLINYCRQQEHALPLTDHEILDSAATIQANYQSSKDLKTDINVPPYKLLSHRMMQYGGTQYAIELVSKSRTERGDENSFYFIASELIRPLLTSAKTYPTLMNKQYTFIGIGTSVEPITGKTMYLSLVFGNDRSFKNDAASQKNPPFTKSSNGIKQYSAPECKKCETQSFYDTFTDYIKYNTGESEVKLVCPNSKIIEKYLGGEGDALILDFVGETQYSCDMDNQIDNNKTNRGYMTKPIYLEDILDANTVTDKKTKALDAIIADVPEEIAGETFQIYAIFTKEGIPCRISVPTYVEFKNTQSKMSLPMQSDFMTYPAKGAYLPQAEEAQFEFQIPFDKSKSEFKESDIKPLIQNLNEPAFTIKKLKIKAYSSLDGDTEANKILQKKRSESIVMALNLMQSKRFQYEIETDNGWELFKKDVIKSTYPELAKLDMETAKKRLTGKTLSDLEPILVKHRYVNITINVEYDLEGKEEENFVVHQFNKALISKNYALATAIQKYIIEKIAREQYDKNVYERLNIADTPENLPFIINKLYMEFQAYGKLSDYSKELEKDLIKKYPQNQILKYNDFVDQVQNLIIQNETDVQSKQGIIDGFMANPALNSANVNQLNFVFQCKVMEYYKANNALAATIQTVFDKMKASVNIYQSNWKDAYNTAAIFAKYKDYALAAQIMDPFIQTIGISNDFIFSYLMLYAYRETMFMSGNFALACKLAARKDKSRFCQIMDKLPYCVLENLEAKKVFCRECK